MIVRVFKRSGHLTLSLELSFMNGPVDRGTVLSGLGKFPERPEEIRERLHGCTVSCFKTECTTQISLHNPESCMKRIIRIAYVEKYLFE